MYIITLEYNTDIYNEDGFDDFVVDESEEEIGECVASILDVEKINAWCDKIIKTEFSRPKKFLKKFHSKEWEVDEDETEGETIRWKKEYDDETCFSLFITPIEVIG